MDENGRQLPPLGSDDPALMSTVTPVQFTRASMAVQVLGERVVDAHARLVAEHVAAFAKEMVTGEHCTPWALWQLHPQLAAPAFRPLWPS